MRRIMESDIYKYRNYLINNEKAESTVKKYMYDLIKFSDWISDKELEKSVVLAYKKILIEGYLPSSVNSALSSINSFFSFMEWYDLRVKNLKIQKQIFLPSDKELTKNEYERLLIAAKMKNNRRLYLLMQTICSVGLRVSEIRYITVEAVNKGIADISLKGKRRQVPLPHKLCVILKQYIKEQKIKSGAIFTTRNGNPLDRSNIWSDMKKLCKEANVSEKKVFPHNLRHLFARTHYTFQKDIVRLADILGHSSVNTTRIYTMESGEIHRKQIQKLGLLLC